MHFKIALELTSEELAALEAASFHEDIHQCESQSPAMQSLGEKIRQAMREKQSGFGYQARDLEDALGKLWALVESRLSEADRFALGIHDENILSRSGIFDELHDFGPRGPVGLGLGCFGGHAVGD